MDVEALISPLLAIPTINRYWKLFSFFKAIIALCVAIYYIWRTLTGPLWQNARAIFSMFPNRRVRGRG